MKSRRQLLEKFRNAEPIIGAEWQNVASKLVIDELRVQIGYDTSGVRMLVNYLTANDEPRTNATREFYRFLSDVMGICGDYHGSWETLLRSDPTYAESKYRHYRTLATHILPPRLSVPWYVPAFARHWDKSAKAELDLVMDGILQSEKTDGKNVIGYYAHLQELVVALVEQEVGMTCSEFRRNWGPPCDKQEIAQRKLLVARLQAALRKVVYSLAPEFCFAFPRTKLESAVNKWLPCESERWLQSSFWDRMDFFSSPTLRWFGDKLNLDEQRRIIASARLVEVPHEFGIIRVAREAHIEKLWRDAENQLRERKALPRVGAGWLSERKLVHLLRGTFPNERIEQQASPKWLGLLRFDAYFVEHNLAVEYHGEQHFKPVEFFGGEVGLARLQQRDARKRSLCAANGCTLIEVNELSSTKKLLAKISTTIQAKRTHTSA